MRYFFPIATVLILFSCGQKSDSPQAKITIEKKWLDSVKASCDTFYIQSYKRNAEFVTAEYYFNRKDTIVSQFMKDSAGTIRQAIIAKKNITRLFFAEYYANGQLRTDYHFDVEGKYDGPSTSYYEDGSVKSEGVYRHGLYAGKWKNYDEKGKLLPENEYDDNGQLKSKN